MHERYGNMVHVRGVCHSGGFVVGGRSLPGSLGWWAVLSSLHAELSHDGTVAVTGMA